MLYAIDYVDFSRAAILYSVAVVHVQGSIITSSLSVDAPNFLLVPVAASTLKPAPATSVLKHCKTPTVSFYVNIIIS